MSVDLFLDEKKFISVKRAAQETGYAQDYIGQLCRQGKIPAKLIGRSWFVDLESLLADQKDVSQKSYRNIDDSSEYKSVLALPRYEYKPLKTVSVEDNLPSLPPLRKKNNKRSLKISLGTKPSLTAVGFLVAVFICGNTAMAWINFIDPGLYGNLTDKVGRSYESFTKKIAGANLAQVSSAVTNDEERGVVVFPETEDRLEETDFVKNVFSDEVEVLVDDGGESGVIRPVFRKGELDRGYAFVIVPVNSSK